MTDPRRDRTQLHRAIILLLLMTMLLPCLLLGQLTWYSENFQRTRFSPDWTPASGPWILENNSASIATGDYDQLLASHYYIGSSSPYSLEVTLKGGRAGVFFSLDDTVSKALSHMVRFDDNSILTGYFDAAGIFTATNTFDLPRSANDWRLLRIDVDPPRKRYAVFVDGAPAGTDTMLVFPSGYFGLQASDGLAAFQNVMVRGDRPPQSVQEPSLGAPIAFEHVGYIKGAKDALLLYFPQLKKHVHIDYDGTVRGFSTADSAPTYPTSVPFSGHTYVIRGKRIFVFTQKGALEDSLVDFLVRPTCMVVSGKSLFVADPGARSIFQFSSAHRLIRTIDAGSIGGFKAPRGIAVVAPAKLAIADYDRIVFWSEHSGSTLPSLSEVRDTGAVLKWTTESTASGWIEIAADGGAWTRLKAQKSSRDAGERSITLTGLKPLTRYSYRYFPVLRTIPESSSISKTNRFATAPSSNETMAVVRLPIMCLVYRTISYRDKYPSPPFQRIPDGKTLTEGDISYLRQATKFNREFFFRNSSCRLALDFDFYVVEDTLWLHDVGDTDPYWLAPNERVTRDFETAARSFNKSPSSYAGIVCPYAWMNYPPRRTSAMRDPSRKDTIMIRQAVGGGTYGVPAPWKYGKSSGYTGNPFQDRFSRQDWLITHEFHHQIDALMDASGFPEYYHADQPWKMPGRFGEDFDFNARIIRNAEPHTWLAMRFGALAECRDEDHDGIPDDDPTLPLDEKRLGTNPHSRDSDSDGVSDLSELMMGTSRGSNPLLPDTDGDGLNDKVDPEPLYPMAPFIPHIDESRTTTDHPFGVIKDSVAWATISAGWSQSGLRFECTSERPLNLLIQIDADDDGWFHGFDNFQIRILNDGDSARVADFYLRDCSSWTDSPRDRRDILKLSDLRLTSEMPQASRQSSGLFRVSVSIPEYAKYGLTMKSGKKIGIRIGVQTVTNFWVWNEMFERNYMMQVTLQ